MWSQIGYGVCNLVLNLIYFLEAIKTTKNIQALPLTFV